MERRRLLACLHSIQKHSDSEIIAAAMTGFYDQRFILVIPIGGIQLLLLLAFGGIPFIIAQHHLLTHAPQILDLSLGTAKAVRIMVGTVAEMASGTEMPPIKEIIKSKNRALAGTTAPAKGLALNKVFY